MGNLFKGKNEEKEESKPVNQMVKRFKDLTEKVSDVCNDLKETLTQMEDINNRILALEEKTQEIEVNAKARDIDVLLPNSESLNCLKLTQISKKIKKEQVDAPENKKLEASRLLNARIRHKEAKNSCFSIFDNGAISISSKTIGKDLEELIIKPPAYVPTLPSGKKDEKLESTVKIEALLKGGLDFSNAHNLDQQNINSDNCMNVEQELKHCGINEIQNIQNELANADTECF